MEKVPVPFIFGVDLILSGGAFGIIKGAKNLGSKSHAFDSSLNVGTDITPVVISNMPRKLNYNTSSGVKLKVNPNKTTTILGNYKKDMKDIIEETNYPKTLDFEAKKGGFNVLNTPDSLYKTPDQFWNEYNKPFLDKAIERGDDIVLATKPDSKLFYRIVDGVKIETGFGREYNYLKSKGYEFDSITSKMVKKGE